MFTFFNMKLTFLIGMKLVNYFCLYLSLDIIAIIIIIYQETFFYLSKITHFIISSLLK